LGFLKTSFTKRSLLTQSLVTASLLTIGASVLSRLLGYVREAVIASHYGTSAVFDTFVLAFTVPELLSFIIFAALPMAVVPSGGKSGDTGTSLQKENAADSLLFWKGLLAFGGIFALLSLLIYLFRVDILSVLAPRLVEDHSSLGHRLIAILALFVFFRGSEAYFRSWLYKRKHFLVPVFSPFLINVVVLIMVLQLHGSLDIEALAYGWLIGSFLAFLFNGIGVLLVLKPLTRFDGVSVSVKPLLRLVLAVVLIESIALIYPVVDRFLAAKYLGEGQIAALRYAIFLMALPPGVLVATFSLASFPWIADYSGSEETDRLKKLYKDSVSLVIFAMGLVMVGMIWFSTELVQVAFLRGVFDQSSLALTVGPFRYYSIGVVFYSLFIYQMRFYYARRAVLRLGIILSVMLLIKIIGSLLLIGPMEHEGLALATSIAWFIGFVVMTVDRSRFLDPSESDLLVSPVRRTLLLLVVVVAFWIGMSQVWPANPSESLMMVLVRVAVSGFSGAAIYFGLALVFKLPELMLVTNSLSRRLQRNGSNET